MRVPRPPQNGTVFMSAAFARVCRVSASRLGRIERKVRLIAPDASCAASRASLRASARAVAFTQCAATNAVHIALVMAPIGLPLGSPK